MVIQRYSNEMEQERTYSSVKRHATLAFIDVRSMHINHLEHPLPLSKCRKQESSCFTEEI